MQFSTTKFLIMMAQESYNSFGYQNSNPALRLEFAPGQLEFRGLLLVDTANALIGNTDAASMRNTHTVFANYQPYQFAIIVIVDRSRDVVDFTVSIENLDDTSVRFGTSSTSFL